MLIKLLGETKLILFDFISTFILWRQTYFRKSARIRNSVKYVIQIQIREEFKIIF